MEDTNIEPLCCKCGRKAFKTSGDSKWYCRPCHDGYPIEVVKPVPFVRLDKTGRNEPCPCGSGKKFKKCCLEAKP